MPDLFDGQVEVPTDDQLVVVPVAVEEVVDLQADTFADFVEFFVIDLRFDVYGCREYI